MFVPGGEQCAIGEFHAGGIAEVAVCAVTGNGDRLAPGFAVIGADARLVTERFAPIAVAHQQSVILQAQQMRWQAPDPNRAWQTPSFATVGGLGLQGFAAVGGIVVSDLRDDCAVGGLACMQFVLLGGVITGPCWDLRQLLPRLAVVF